jgi:signal transduction histidine kinase
MVVFIAGYANYVFSGFSSNTQSIATEALQLYADSNGQTDTVDFRYRLSIIGAEEDVAEILMYDNNCQLLASTTYTKENTNFFDSDGKNIVTTLFPQFSKLGNGYYADVYEVTSSSDVHYVLIYYTATSVLEESSFILQLLSATMLLGVLLFMVFGIYRTERMLQPISEVTAVAKQINGNNLNLRIDASNAKYELCELVETINQMMDRIQMSYERQKRFVSDVSHELRTPISVIAGYADMLRRWGRDDTEVLDESIGAILSEAENMNDLVEKLLFLARHDNDNIVYEFAQTDVSKLCSEVVKDAMLVHHDITFVLHAEHELMANVDAMRLKQMFRIFIDNAVKYSGESKTVEITLKRENKELLFSVKDYGLGIAKKDLPNIFERFYRADESRTKSTGGYGLGLAMAKIIVQGHGGRITVRSKVGEGSEFLVFLPLDAAVTLRVATENLPQ